jgi:predicted lipid-binding transport protein (Tim44 family)
LQTVAVNFLPFSILFLGTQCVSWLANRLFACNSFPSTVARAESTDGGSSSSEQEEVTSSAPASPSGSEEQLAAAAAAAQATGGHHVDQPAEADAQPLPSDDESVASTEVMDPAADSEESDHLGSP